MHRRRRYAAFFLFSVLFLAVGHAGSAEIIYVCDSGCDHSNLQDAVDAAKEDDIIQINSSDLSDTYSGVQIPVKNLTLQSEEGVTPTIGSTGVNCNLEDVEEHGIRILNASILVKDVKAESGGADFCASAISIEGEDAEIRNVTATGGDEANAVEALAGNWLIVDSQLETTSSISDSILYADRSGVLRNSSTSASIFAGEPSIHMRWHSGDLNYTVTVMSSTVDGGEIDIEFGRNIEIYNTTVKDGIANEGHLHVRDNSVLVKDDDEIIVRGDGDVNIYNSNITHWSDTRTDPALDVENGILKGNTLTFHSGDGVKSTSSLDLRNNTVDMRTTAGRPIIGRANGFDEIEDLTLHVFQDTTDFDVEDSGTVTVENTTTNRTDNLFTVNMTNTTFKYREAPQEPYIHLSPPGTTRYRVNRTVNQTTQDTVNFTDWFSMDRKVNYSFSGLFTDTVYTIFHNGSTFKNNETDGNGFLGPIRFPNVSKHKIVVRSGKPTSSNEQANISEVEEENAVRFRVRWEVPDHVKTVRNLQNYTLYWNESGEWENASSGTLSGNTSWSNTTAQLPVRDTYRTVGWYIKAEDTENGIGKSKTKTFAGLRRTKRLGGEVMVHHYDTYDHDADAGTTADRSTVRGDNDGVLENGLENTVPTPGMFEQSYSFDGENDRIKVSDDPSLRVSGNVTVMAWTKFNTTADDQETVILQKGGETGTNYRLIYDGVTDTLRFQYNTTTAGDRHTVKTRFIPNQGEWYHIAATVNQTSTQFETTLYIDTNEKNTTTWSGAGAEDIHTDTDDVLIGNGPGAAPVNGSVDEARIYNVSLNQTQINDIFETPYIVDAVARDVTVTPTSPVLVKGGREYTFSAEWDFGPFDDIRLIFRNADTDESVTYSYAEDEITGEDLNADDEGTYKRVIPGLSPGTYTYQWIADKPGKTVKTPAETYRVLPVNTTVEVEHATTSTVYDSGEQITADTGTVTANFENPAYLAAVHDDSLFGLVDYSVLSTELDGMGWRNTSTVHRFNMTQTGADNAFILPYTKPPVTRITQHHDLLEKEPVFHTRSFLEQVNPSFAYPLRDEQNIRYILSYEESRVNLSSDLGSVSSSGELLVRNKNVANGIRTITVRRR